MSIVCRYILRHLRFPHRLHPRSVDISGSLSFKESHGSFNGASLSQIFDNFAFILRHFQYEPCTEAATALIRFCASTHPHILDVTLHVQDNENSMTTVNLSEALQRTESPNAPTPYRFEQDVHDWGHVDILYENAYSGLYMLNIRPLNGIPRHVHYRTHEAEMMLSEGIACNDQLLSVGDVVQWNLGEAHDYVNRDSMNDARILCIDTPPFQVDDEVPEPKTLTNPTANNDHHKGDFSCHFDRTHWELLLRHTSSREPSFEFPGAFAGQSVKMFITADAPPSRYNIDAVLIVAFDSNNDVILCRHRKRGWELPGGKREPNESAVEAAIRELYEESGANLDSAHIRPFAYYQLYEEAKLQHTKQIYVCRVAEPLQRLSSSSEMISVAHESLQNLSFSRIAGDEKYSILMRDNVVPIALNLSYTALHGLPKFEL